MLTKKETAKTEIANKPKTIHQNSLQFFVPTRILRKGEEDFVVVFG